MSSAGKSFNHPWEGKRKFATSTVHRDPLYLFARHLQWRDGGSINAYQDLVSALDDPNKHIRAVAEMLVRRGSPHP